MSGRPKAELVLSEAEREQLTALMTRRKTAQALALRARIVLACAEGTDNRTVVAKLRVTQQTVSKWRGRYAMHRLEACLTHRVRAHPDRSTTHVLMPLSRFSI